MFLIFNLNNRSAVGKKHWFRQLFAVFKPAACGQPNTSFRLAGTGRIPGKEKSILYSNFYQVYFIFIAGDDMKNKIFMINIFIYGRHILGDR